MIKILVESCEHDLNSDKKFGTETDISVRALRMTTEVTWSDGVLYRKWENDDGSSCRRQLILPKSRIQEVLQETHDSASRGHFGIMKTLRRIRERFYWDRLRSNRPPFQEG
ncbi:hypothetical protein AVEN_77589-1 [Araneus ventricosus]|uniref:Integrase zinc-binding domain-containing protein n=1 Tax=Araneus ventricosus TaxID=182803 RepID=A0A4Y2KCB5_ARAVE|nr:hypothetical protein AVEN_77589-1 [Araneus ventricosus]